LYAECPYLTSTGMQIVLQPEKANEPGAMTRMSNAIARNERQKFFDIKSKFIFYSV